MILERGALLNNRYRIVEILGQGGMGSVYRAVDENLGVEVAVKDNLFTTAEYARQFRREAVILANLRHPNLPRVTDHFVIEDQGQYLVMDYIEGEDLRQRMDRVGVLSDAEVILIGSAICDALTYLSSRNPAIVHRDIKPGNVKISPQGQIFLVDFGLAKVIQGTQATTTGARAMTPGYSPPEQYGTARTDHRSDIFSLGATLFAALTGAIPEDALSRAMDQVDLTPIRKHNQRVSRRLAAVIEKSLEVRPDDRYQTPEEFKQALRSAMPTTRRRAGENIVDPPPDLENKPLPADSIPAVAPVSERVARSTDRSPLPLPISSPLEEELVLESSRSRPRGRRSRSRMWIVVMLLIVGLVVAVVGMASLADPLILSRARAWLQSTPTSISSPTLDLSLAVPETALPIATSTTTIQVALEAPNSDATPTEQPLPTQTATPTSTPEPLPTQMGGGSGELAFAFDRTGVPEIYMINSEGTVLTQLTDMQSGACQPEWSPDGMRLAFISPCQSNQDAYPSSTIFIINVDGTGLSPLPGSDPRGDFDPAWSPDGTRIAFTTLRDGNRPRIWVYNLVDNSVQPLSDPKLPYSRDSQPAWSPDGQKIAFITTRRGPYQIWVMDADGKNQELFSHSKDMVNDHPVWSPDGKFILFTQMNNRGEIPRLVVAPYPYRADTYKEFLLSKDSIPMRDGRYSPDGAWIAFEAWPAGGLHDIYISAANGAGRRQLTTERRADFDPAWRPAPK